MGPIIEGEQDRIIGVEAGAHPKGGAKRRANCSGPWKPVRGDGDRCDPR